MKTYSELLKNQNECINSDIKAAKGPKAIHSKFQNMIFKKKKIIHRSTNFKSLNFKN